MTRIHQVRTSLVRGPLTSRVLSRRAGLRCPLTTATQLLTLLSSLKKRKNEGGGVEEPSWNVLCWDLPLLSQSQESKAVQVMFTHECTHPLKHSVMKTVNGYCATL